MHESGVPERAGVGFEARLVSTQLIPMKDRSACTACSGKGKGLARIFGQYLFTPLHWPTIED